MADQHTHAPATTAEHPPAADAHSNGAGGHRHSYLHHVRPYLLVGAALFLFTLITVGLSYVDFDHILGSHGMNMKIGMGVATFKVCLVGAWFMHLKSEKRSIWLPLGFTFFFCLGLFILCLLAYSDPIHSTSHPLH
jgi:caa(3)-type oxidase subunit IV